MTDRSDISEAGGSPRQFVAFDGVARIATGDLAEVALAAKDVLRRNPAALLIVFDRETGAVADLELRGTEQEVTARYTPAAPSGAPRGRPKLGVVAREVTLLPRHWDWLARQPGGASTTLRRLVEAARKADDGATKSRERIEAAYRFMSAMAGDRPRFEEASRALFADDRRGFATAIAQWPSDIRDELLRFIERAISSAPIDRE